MIFWQGLPDFQKAQVSTCGITQPEISQQSYKRALAYMDCWVEDSRLVLLNILDAEKEEQKAFSYSKVTNIKQKNGQWLVSVKSKEKSFEIKTKVLINTMGPWVNSFHQLDKNKKINQWLG